MREPRIVQPGPLHDRGFPYAIVGSNEDDRSLKTKFTNERQATAWAMYASYIRALYKGMNELRKARGEEPLTMQQAMKVYSCLANAQNAHLQGTGHLVSVEGFSVKASVEAAKLAREEASQETVAVHQATNGVNGNGTAPQYS